MADIINELDNILQARLDADPESSYVASLYAGGTGEILKKIGEEATELVIAGLSTDKQAIVHESADLLFHTLVLLVHNGLSAADLLAELERRQGQSGLDEKRKRSNKNNK